MNELNNPHSFKERSLKYKAIVTSEKTNERLEAGLTGKYEASLRDTLKTYFLTVSNNHVKFGSREFIRTASPRTQDD